MLAGAIWLIGLGTLGLPRLDPMGLMWFALAGALTLAARISTALAAYFAGVPIGGFRIAGIETGRIYLDDIRAAIATAAAASSALSTSGTTI